MLALLRHKWSTVGLILLVGLVCGPLFAAVRLPIPWLLGPMIGVLVCSRLLARNNVKLYWPGYFRNTGMIITGYALGLSFTLETLQAIGNQLPSMALMTLLLLLLCGLIAYGFAKASGIPFATALLGSIPGGLSQMVALAEETKGIDITVVTFLQVSRLMMIVSFIPLLIFSPLFGSVHTEDLTPFISGAASRGVALFPAILPYAVICVAGALIGKKLHFPTTFLLVPMLATALLHLWAGLDAPALPPYLLKAAQLLIGSYVGLLLKPEKLPNKTRMATLAVVCGVVLIVGSCAMSYLLTVLHPVSAATSLLSLAPGGMDQMGIIAHEIDADVSIVTCYQIFRTFFIFFALPPLLRIWLGRLGNVRGEG